MKKILIIMYCVWACHKVSAQNVVSQIQYWYDQSFANAVTVPAVSGDFSSDISTAGLAAGEHVLHKRTMQTDGKWSSVISTNFVVVPKINNVQYWFDMDFANAQMVSVSPTEEFDYLAQISASTLSPGEHSIKFRSQQTNGKWSSVVTQSFFVISNHTSIQYWFDNNYSNAQFAIVASDKVLDYNALISGTSIPNGFHTLRFRTLDNRGRYSSVISSDFIKHNQIVAYEYWFDKDYTAKQAVALSAPVEILDINGVINAANLNGTEHTIHIRTQQSNGTWSVVSSQDFRNPNLITAYEYWFNSNYAGKIVQSIPPSVLSEINPSLDVSMAPLGTDTIFIRFKDKNNKWSSTITSIFCHQDGDSNLTLKVLLEGYYAGAGTLQSVLLNQGASADPLVCDNITVELRNTTAPFALVYTCQAVLKTNGVAKCFFPTTGGNYYVVVKHRNSLETWSAQPIYVGVCPVEYNFTTGVSKAFGGVQKEVESGMYALYTGDIDQNGYMELDDYNLWDIQYQAGYPFSNFTSDLDGNGFVELDDYNLWDANYQDAIFSITP